ncbi:MAG: hypothetical protein H6623_04530 [Bdellovibrionaceae bacterium]|nr:hypothetical protein [Pseudobdellovibrionaceae bacterium]
MTNDFAPPQINRAALVLFMQQPCVDWVNSLPEEGESQEEALTIEEANMDPVTYMIPEIFDETDFALFLEKAWPLLFQMQLSAWTAEESLWPKKRTFDMFCDWFGFNFSSLVIDVWGQEELGYIIDDE